METPKAALSIATGTDGGVRSVEPDAVSDLFAAIYDQVVVARPGMLGRSLDWWKHHVVYDPVHWRDGSSAKRFVVYEADGPAEAYAIYTQKSKWDDFVAEGEIKVAEAISVTDRAHTGLWDYLTSIDLYPRVRYWNMPVDDPLIWKLAEPRRAERKRTDGLWIRIMDVPAALEARTYEVDGTIRLGVDDPFLPERSGVYELAASEGQGKTVVVDGEADVTLGIDVLGALYLGGNNAVSMAAAGLIDGSPEAVALLHRLFRTEIDPWCPEVF